MGILLLAECAFPLRAAESSIRAEASSVLTKAGEMFKKVLELERWSSRALVRSIARIKTEHATHF
jgi:hypothetical protein